MKENKLTTTFCNNVLNQYSPAQMEKITKFIEKNFGGGNEGWVCHELTSEGIHVDVLLCANEDNQYLVTFGMGSMEMCNLAVLQDEKLKRLEVLFNVSRDYKMTNEEKLLLANELMQIAKYPSRENTFFGPGHTINASKKFKEKFGYDYFLFFVPIEKLKLGKLGNVHFIPLIPIYEKEREWMVKNNSLEWLYANEDLDNAIFVDKKREIFIPNK